MKILVVSDSHGNQEALDRLANMYPNMDLFLCCGDSEGDEWNIQPFRSVRGNCDHYYDFPEYLIIPTPYGKLFVQHYPNVNYQELINKGIKLFIHGHTHVRKDEMKYGIRVLNPGSISFSRDGFDLSYMIVTIEQSIVNVTFNVLKY